MVEELLAESKALAERGDLTAARAKLKELEDWLDTEEDIVAATAWNAELKQLENADFMASLEPRSEPAGEPQLSTAHRDENTDDGSTVLEPPSQGALQADSSDAAHAETVLDRTLLSGQRGSEPALGATALRAVAQPQVVVIRHVAALEPVPILAPKVVPQTTPEPAALFVPAPAARAKPTEAVPAAAPGMAQEPDFRDSRLEAILARGPQATAGVASPSPAPMAAAPESGPTAGAGTGQRQRTKAAKKGVFRPEVVAVLAGIAVVVVVLEPWKWGHDKKTPAAAADSRYPDVSFRESRIDAVTPEAVRAQFGQKKEPPKPEFTTSLTAAMPPARETQHSAQTADFSGTSKLAGAHARAATHTPVATAPIAQVTQVAAEQTPAPAEPMPARRRGSRYYNDAPPEEPGAGAAKKPTGVQPAGLPVNTRIRAELQIGITSTKHDAVVLARVLAPVQVADKVLVPKGALLRGRSSNDKDRVYIRFSELIVGKDKLSIDASVVEGDLPGVHAQKREATLEERQQSRVAQGALGAAADVALSLTGAGAAATALRGVSSGAVQETQQAQQYDTSVVLIVPARTPLELVVVE